MRYPEFAILKLENREKRESNRLEEHKDHGPINYIDTKAKCRHIKKLTCKGTLRQVFICLRPPPLLGFCLGRFSNFVDSESGQIKSVKLLQNMVSNRTRHPPPPPSHTRSAAEVIAETVAP